ncbi:MAG: hypothetical protein ACTSPK_14810, partial [Candidatus Heimdallarchaeota archaeon]
ALETDDFDYSLADLAEILQNNNFVVDTLGYFGIINDNVLRECDIFVIYCSHAAYTTSEIQSIYSWVRNGGSLLLVSDYGPTSSVRIAISGIIGIFGYVFGSYDIFDWDNYNNNYWNLVHDDDCIKPHEITKNITRIESYGTWGIINSPGESQTIITTDSDGTAYWTTPPNYPANNIPILSVCENMGVIIGKIAVLNDAHMFTGMYDSDHDDDLNIFDSDNEVLALNLFTWLGKESIVDVTSNQSIYFSFIAIFGILVYLVRRKSSK